MENRLTVDELYEQHEHLVKITLHKLFQNPAKLAQKHNLDYDDLMQFGRIGLFNGCKSYYTSKHDSTLKSYMIRNIRWGIMKSLTRATVSNRLYRSREASEDNVVKVISMSQNPSRELDDDSSFYDVIASDNIYNFTTESDYPENRVVSDINMNETVSKLMKLLKKDIDKEILSYRLMKEPVSFIEIGRRVGLTKQAVQQRYKNIQKKCRAYLEVHGV